MAVQTDVNDQLVEITRAFWNDRVGFVKSIFKTTPTEQQGQALEALDKEDFVSVGSGHGCGKSTVETWLIWHYLCCRPFPKIPCTAPSKHQLYDVLWAEISKWHRKMNSIYRYQFEWTKERVFHVDFPEEWFAAARTATKENPDALQGIHAEYVLRIIDEASGVPEPIFEVSDGAHGSIETKEIMCANPTRLEGTFFRSHHRDKDHYKVLTWSCLDSPIAPARYITRMERKYGKDSNIYRVRVLGKFPLADGDSFVPYHLVEDARIRELVPQAHLPVVFGVDVARFGDDSTVIAIRQGDEFKPYHVLRGKSTMEVAGYIVSLANEHKPAQIFVDVLNMGAGVVDRLEEQGLPVIGINVTETPAYSTNRYRRLRDELWGNMRTWLEARRGKLWDNNDDDLLGQLTTPKYTMTSNGLIVIESKDDMKRRGFDSPDIADAHNLTFAMPTSNYTKPDVDLDEEDEDRYKPFDSEVGYGWLLFPLLSCFFGGFKNVFV